MEDLTLVIPAKYEASTLPKVLDELEKFNVKKIITVPKYDKETLEAIKDYDCKIVHQNGEGFGNALIEGISNVETKYLCIFNADGSFDPKYLNEMIIFKAKNEKAENAKKSH